MQSNTAVMTAHTLAEAAWPVRESSKWLRAAVLVVAGALFLTLCAKIQVPLRPVPMTMQTFGVLVIAAAYGWPLGAGSVLLYLAAGFIGLPVFAGAAVPGPAYFMGPTGGFLIGFLVAAQVVGWLCERHRWDRSFVTTAVAMAVGSAVIYAIGVLWLYVVFAFVREAAGWDLMRAFNVAMKPFLVGDLLKLLLATALLPLAWKLVQGFRKGS